MCKCFFVQIFWRADQLVPHLFLYKSPLQVVSHSGIEHGKLESLQKTPKSNTFANGPVSKLKYLKSGCSHSQASNLLWKFIILVLLWLFFSCQYLKFLSNDSILKQSYPNSYLHCWAVQIVRTQLCGSLIWVHSKYSYLVTVTLFCVQGEGSKRAENCVHAKCMAPNHKPYIPNIIGYHWKDLPHIIHLTPSSLLV